MERFDLFNALDMKKDDEAFIYRGGYYIINKFCNKVRNYKIRDTFYTIYFNLLLKINVIERGERQYFNIYKIRDFTDSQILEIKIYTENFEDISEQLLKTIINIEKYSIFAKRCKKEDAT